MAGGGAVIDSKGERVPLTDPRVKLYLPNFSQYHTQTLGLAMHWLGLHPGRVAPLTRTQLNRGLRHTSGRECLPLPLSVGEILQIHERREPGEIGLVESMRQHRRPERRRIVAGGLFAAAFQPGTQRHIGRL